MEVGRAKLAAVVGVLVATTACSSTSTNPGATPSGGAAGAPTGGGTGGTSGSGGAAGAGGGGGFSGAGGSAGAAGGSGAPSLVDAQTLAVSGEQFASDIEVPPTGTSPRVLGYGKFGTEQLNFVADLGPSGEVSRRTFSSTGEAYLMGLTTGGNGAIHVSGMYKGSVTLGVGKTVQDAAGDWAAVTGRIIPQSPTDAVVAYTYAGAGNQELRDNAPYAGGVVSVGSIQKTVTIHGAPHVADDLGDALLSVEFAGTANNKDVLFSGAGRQGLSGVVTTANNDVIAVGDSPALPTLTVIGSNSGGQLAMVLRYDQTLTMPVWTAALGSSGSDAFQAVALDAKTGDIVAVGWVAGQVTLSSTSKLDYVGGEDVVVACFTENGDLRWARTFGGPANDRAYGVAIASSGDIFVAGSTKSPSFASGAGTLTKKGDEDGVLLRLDADGNPKFAALIGSSGSSQCGPITAAHTGDVVLACRFQGNFELLGKSVQGNPDAGALWDLAVLTLVP